MKARLCVWICLLFLSSGLFARQLSPSDRAATEMAMKTIRGDAIRAHMRFLADSLLQGRAPDSSGYQIAARYVATQLEGMGLRPGGLNGTWFQQVPLRKAVLDTSKSSMVLIANGPGSTTKNKRWSMPRTIS